MGKISDLRDQIDARGGSWMHAWEEDELQEALGKLPEVVLPSRRAVARSAYGAEYCVLGNKVFPYSPTHRNLLLNTTT